MVTIAKRRPERYSLGLINKENADSPTKVRLEPSTEDKKRSFEEWLKIAADNVSVINFRKSMDKILGISI
jgi:hypothetical protein